MALGWADKFGMSPLEVQQYERNEDLLRRRKEAMEEAQKVLGVTPSDTQAPQLGWADSFGMNPLDVQKHDMQADTDLRTNEVLDRVKTLTSGGMRNAPEAGQQQPQGSPQLGASLPDGMRSESPQGVGPAVSNLGIGDELSRLQMQYPDIPEIQTVADLYGQQVSARQKEEQNQVTNKAISQLSHTLELSEDPADQAIAKMLNVYRNTGRSDQAIEAMGDLFSQRLNIGEENNKQAGRLDLEEEKSQNQKELEKYKTDLDIAKQLQLEAMEKAKSGFSKEEQDAVRNFLGRVDKDLIVKRATQSVSAAKPIMDVLQLENPVADEALKVLIPRLMGEVGNLSQAEQEAYGGSRAITDRLGQAYQKALDGTASEANRKYLWDLATTMYNSSRKVLENRIEQMIPQEVQLSGVDETALRGVVGTYSNLPSYQVNNYPWQGRSGGGQSKRRSQGNSVSDPENLRQKYGY